MFQPRPARTVLALPVLLAFFSCSESPTGASPRAEPDDRASLSLVGVSLLSCSSGETQSASEIIGPEGGFVRVAGHELLIPEGAVADLQRFHVEARSSPYLVVTFRAEGYSHFEFLAPVQLTVSYARCEATAESTPGLSVYYVEDGTLDILQDLGGSLDASANTLTARTDHLSDYAVGSPQ